MTPAPISVGRLRELLAKATPGPWRCTDGPAGYQHRVSSDDADGETVCDVERTSADAALIVAAVNALPALLQQLAEREAEVERLRIELEVSNTACGEYASQAMQASFRAQEAERAREEAERDLHAIYEAVPGLPIYATEEDAARATDAFTAICHLCDEYIASDGGK